MIDGEAQREQASLIKRVGISLCQTLFSAGYTAYFAGGYVRDLLLGKECDEIDIATSAPPDIIRKLFPKTIPVGIAFGVVIVMLEGIPFEVSTFRKDHPYIDGRHPEGVDFSTPEKDAQRRDFTINGMFYDPINDLLHDYVGGKEDLERGIIRAIGNPYERFTEDRLRLLRAVRFATRLGFQIEEQTQAAIISQAGYLFPSVSIERVWQELNKMASLPYFDHALKKLYQLGLLSIIFPQMEMTSHEELVKKITALPYFPPKTPTILYLLELFPEFSQEARLQLCYYLKTPVIDQKLVIFFTESENLFLKKDAELYEWAHFYAHPESSLFLAIKAAKLSPPEKLHFLTKHTTQIEKLAPHIERIRIRKPIVQASHLMKLGIQPGKAMGSLLKEAERVSINQNLHDPQAILKILEVQKKNIQQKEET